MKKFVLTALLCAPALVFAASQNDRVPAQSVPAVIAPTIEYEGCPPEGMQAAAKRGDPVAQYCLGCCFLNGSGVDRDIKKALQWWGKAAAQGLPIAQAMLGFCFDQRGMPTDVVDQLQSAGVGRDLKESVRWFRKAAEQGYGVAQFKVGLAYFSGEGVVEDAKEAYAWLVLARATGYDTHGIASIWAVLETRLSRSELEECRAWARKQFEAQESRRGK